MGRLPAAPTRPLDTDGTGLHGPPAPQAAGHGSTPHYTGRRIDVENMAKAILRIIYDYGPKVRTSQIYKALEAGRYFTLQEHHLEETRYGGRPAYQHAVRSYLSNIVQEGLADRLERGVYEITQSGRKVIENV
jgi:hypothetical protein